MRRTRQTRNAGQVVAVMIMGIALSLSVLAAGDGKQTLPGKQWPMKYEEGPIWIRSGAKIEVTVWPDRIMAFTKKTQELAASIPTEKVTEVFYFAETSRRSAPILRSVKDTMTGGVLAKWGEARDKQLEYERALSEYYQVYTNPQDARLSLMHQWNSPLPTLNLLVISAGKEAWRPRSNEDVSRSRLEKLWKLVILERERREAREELFEICRNHVVRCDPRILLDEGLGRTLYGAGWLVVAGVLAPFKTTKHFVVIRWQEGNDIEEVVFKVGKGEYEPFLKVLELATGRPRIVLQNRVEAPGLKLVKRTKEWVKDPGLWPGPAKAGEARLTRQVFRSTLRKPFILSSSPVGKRHSRYLRTSKSERAIRLTPVTELNGIAK